MKRRLRILLIPSVLAALALVNLSCGDDDENPMNPPPGGGADVTITIVADAGSSAYSPSPTTVTLGQTVAWKNNRSVTHTATGGGGINTGDIAPGATSAPIPMNTAGTFAYSCVHHPSMTGSLTVNNP